VGAVFPAIRSYSVGVRFALPVNPAVWDYPSGLFILPFSPSLSPVPKCSPLEGPPTSVNDMILAPSPRASIPMHGKSLLKTPARWKEGRKGSGEMDHLKKIWRGAKTNVYILHLNAVVVSSLSAQLGICFLSGSPWAFAEHPVFELD
jgi:hypothetical protein